MSHAVETVQFRAVRVHVLAGVATVTIDNPPLNVYDVDLIQDLRVLAATVHGDGAIRVVVLQSADPEFFVAHGDSNVVTTPDLMSRAAEGFETGALNYMQVLHEQWRALPQVTIAKLAGFARGGGLELAMALDMRFAAIGTARLAMPEAMIDIVPGGGGSQYLPQLVGRARALEIILGGVLVDAELAERYGLVNRALPADEIDDYVDDLAQRIARLAPGVIAAATASIDASATETSITGALAVENTQMMSLMTPTAVQRSVDLLSRGLQTREGEKVLEEILTAPR